MCIHASWLNSDLCTRCHLKPQGITSLGLEKPEGVKRHVSTLPKRIIHNGPLPQVGSFCIGCGNTVNPGFCYTGSILSDLIHATFRSSHTTPVLGVMKQIVGHASSKGNVEKDVVLGGHTIESSKPVAFRKRTKGLICSSCAACTTTVEQVHKDGSVERIPLVMTDPLGGYLGETARGADTDPRRFKRGPVFNTRVTQGRRGKRV